MAQTTLRLEYSAFFSSGLLAQHTPQKKKLDSSFSWDATNATFDHSPSRSSSPIPIPDESLMDIDMASFDDRRSVTPTPRIKTPMQSPQPVKIQATLPKLRKRRSSLTLATSPMNAIRSPTRAVNNALHMQRQLYTAIGPASPRSRSGSLAGEDALASRFGNAGVASSETSLGGRLGGGSFGCPPVPVRSRSIRRLYISALQAPSTPPPTIPLPALPPHSDQQHLRPANLNTPTPTAHTKVFSISSASTTSARVRGLSVSSSSLDGDEHRIDEDMKEN